jgi:hypothetical protein
MEQQRKAAEAEMRRQADYERKMVEQQNRAMQEQVKAQQKAMQEQQRLMQNQQKAAQNQQKTAQNAQTNPSKTGSANQGQGSTHTTTTPAPHITTTQTTTPVYHAARPYYSAGHVYHRTTYRTYRANTNQNQLDPQTRAMLRLKTSLDHVRMGSPVTPAETTSIKRALMGVVNVPKVPTVASIQTLANHLAEGLANRASSNAQTGPMAMTLMGALNSTEIANSDLNEIMNEHRSALRGSRVRPTEITPIMDSLKTVANQERYRR